MAFFNFPSASFVSVITLGNNAPILSMFCSVRSADSILSFSIINLFALVVLYLKIISLLLYQVIYPI